MAGNRKATEEYILTWLQKITNDDSNVEIYKNFFKTMSDKDFFNYMTDIEKGTKFLTITAPVFNKTALSVERNIKLGKELGHNFFQKIWIGAKEGMPAYLTPIPYLVIDLPIRRASQLLTKKISTPEHNKTVDVLSGQPTSASKGSKISYPEIQVLAAMGLDESIVELIKYRGGDNKGFSAMNAMISKLGSTNMKTLSGYASGVESTKTLKTFLVGMMLKNNL